jgi:hypothetical protein
LFQKPRSPTIGQFVFVTGGALLGNAGRLKRLQYEIKKMAAETITYGNKAEMEFGEFVSLSVAIEEAIVDRLPPLVDLCPRLQE